MADPPPPKHTKTLQPIQIQIWARADKARRGQVLEAQIDFQLTLTNNQLIFLNICILSCETSSKLLFGNLYCSNNYFCNFCISTAFYWGINFLTILDISPNINHSNRVTMENPLKVGQSRNGIFNFGPIFQAKMNQIMVPQFFNLKERSNNLRMT